MKRQTRAILYLQSNELMMMITLFQSEMMIKEDYNCGSANGENHFLLDIGLYGRVVRVDLGHLSAHLETVNVSFGLHVIVSQTVSDGRRFAAGQLERFLVKLRSVSISLLFFADETHQLLSFSTGTIFFQQLPQNVFCIVEFVYFNI